MVSTAGPSSRTGGVGGATRPPHLTDGGNEPLPVKPGSLRERVRKTPATFLAWRIGVFVFGLLFMGLGVALSVLPGPLTIPPVLVGLYVWSTEFAWARRIFVGFRRKAKETWEHAKRRPVSSAAITVGGLALAGAAIWAVGHFQLVSRATSALGL